MARCCPCLHLHTALKWQESAQSTASLLLFLHNRATFVTLRKYGNQMLRRHPCTQPTTWPQCDYECDSPEVAQNHQRQVLKNQRLVEVDEYVQPKALQTKRGIMATTPKSLRKPMR